jgi:Fic family protein
MLKQSFTSTSPGRLIKNMQGNWAFVADPLPPRIEWTDSLVRVTSHASQMLGQLAGLGRKLRNPQRLVRMFLRREAQLSSEIENTHASVQTMLLFEQMPAVEHDVPDVREVQNNFRALKFAMESSANRGMTRSLIKQMHEILLRDVRGGDKSPGSFRTVQAHIGQDGDIKNARFVPGPPHEIDHCMEQLEAFLKHKDQLPPIVRVAMVHYQFEAIHPFADGNGRIGRALLLLQLMREADIPVPLLNPSARLELRRKEYYDRLLGVSLKGQWAEWIEFIAACIAEDAVDAIARIERLDALREQYYERIRQRGASALVLRMIDELFSEPSVTITQTAKLLGITQPGAAKLLGRLLDAGIIREVTGRKRNRVFLAQEVVDLFAVTEES